MPELCDAFGFVWAKEAGYEADDFLAAAVAYESDRRGEALVLTSDRDLFQLASERTTILLPRRGVSELARFGPEQVRETYGVEPSQVPDFIALRGDSSDKIPGVPGVGPQKAAQVLREYDTLDSAIESGRFQKHADELRTYVRITRLRYEAPVPEIPDAEPDWAGAAAWAERNGLSALSKRLRERVG
jgi:DNA polymerase-1